MQKVCRSWLFVPLILGCLVMAAHRGYAAPTSALVISEVLVGNASTNVDPDYFNFSQWIEIKNVSGGPISLRNYSVRSLPDGAAEWRSYTIPTKVVISPGGYFLLWADGAGKDAHLSYDLDMDGGRIALHGPDGAMVDSVELGEQEPDVSFGRSSVNEGVWAYFDSPTPGAANLSPAYEALEFAAEPEFSIAGGMHAGPAAVALSSAEDAATIRYTLDGSKPTESSPVYSEPIPVTSTSVIRARSWVAGKLVSPAANQTYLINIPVNLPIISITADPDYLWDPMIGIYTQGSNGIKECGELANWHQSWERAAAFEYYEMDGTRRLNQQVGLEIFGNCTRNHPRKSFEIKARKLYGDNDLDYAFFAGDKPMTSYKRLILRNSGQDNHLTLMRDALSNMLIKGRMDVDFQAYRPVVVYLNGEYWGLYNMREKMDEDYIESNYDLDEDEFDVLEQNGRLVSGSVAGWREFFAYLSKSKLASPAVYANVSSRMDVDEFMNYLIIHMYAAVTDWPNRNSRFWDGHGEEYRWRWLMRDLDSGFMPASVDLDMFRWMAKKGGPTSVVARRLLTNTGYRAEFGQRFAFHLNTTFDPTQVQAVIGAMEATIQPEMPAHIARWGRPESFTQWEAEVQKLRNFAALRPSYMRAHLRKMLGNPQDILLTVNISGGGRVLVAGGEVSEAYSGLHFSGIPLSLEAIPEPGYRFIGWAETGDTSAAITLPLAADTTRTAVFEVAP